MTTERHLERDLPSILDDLAVGPYPDYIDDVLTITAHRRHRPAWTFPERWLPMAELTRQRGLVATPPFRLIGLALLAIALIVATVLVVGSQQRRLPAPFGPATNGLISYDLAGDVYAGDPATGESRLILGGATHDIEPAYSRDGTRIAFLRLLDPDDDKVFRIMAMDTDGSNVNVVTPDPITSPNWWDWTPSGDLIVVARTTGKVQDITVYDGVGVEPPRTLTGGIEADAPVYRPPDSREILFRGRIGDQAGVYVMNADGTGLRPIIPPTRIPKVDVSLMEPRYSPDGTRIAVHQWDEATETMRLYVMNADGTDRRELGRREDIWFTGWPVWSNDGTSIAAAHVERGRALAGPYVVIDVLSDTIIRTGPDAPQSGSRIEWAPDDTSILMSWNDAPRQVLLDPDGGPARELPWQAAAYPSWQRVAPPD